MSTYADFFLNTGRNIVQLELIEISHPSFSQVYRRVRNAVNGVTVTLETGGTAFFAYYPMKVTSLGVRTDLDAGFKITFGDLGTIIPLELDRVRVAGTFNIKPVVKYRAYRSDQLSLPMVGPLVLEASTFSFGEEGASFEAKAPLLNINGTGELYEIERFTSLRGLL
jgi:hypothetical protein